jgi:hypothetical protein
LKILYRYLMCLINYVSAHLVELRLPVYLLAGIYIDRYLRDHAYSFAI